MIDLTAVMTVAMKSLHQISTFSLTFHCLVASPEARHMNGESATTH